MGNIKREVFPTSLRSPEARETRDVNMISMHHPAAPHFKKSFILFSIGTVWQKMPPDMQKDALYRYWFLSLS